MYFKIVLSIIVIISTIFISNAQGNKKNYFYDKNIYSYARVYFNEKFTAEDAIDSGMNFENSVLKRGVWIEAVLNKYELSFLKACSLKIEIIIPDLEHYYEQRLKSFRQVKDKAEVLKTVEFDFSGGSMGGFYTLEEIYIQFDRMRIKYPQYFSDFRIIGYSCEGRHIYSYCFGDTSGRKPELLLTALHHAREPGSVMVLIYFLWNLLEMAASGHPEAVYLLESRSIYVIPCVNPDGYLYNETQYPEGGGMWRKNRRRIDDSTFGVDINRNYGPRKFWDSPLGNSSKNPKWPDYRGEAPFSEPETQAIRDFCRAHNFKTAINYHTYGNLLIYPYSALACETPDSILYRFIAADFTAVNKYFFGLDSATVGYHVRGQSDDWMYHSEPEKDKILAMTAEVGTPLDGFWPLPDRILAHSRENFHTNFQAVWSAGVNLRPAELICDFDTVSYRNYITVIIRNIGVGDLQGTAVLRLTPLDSAIRINSPERNIFSFVSGAEISERFELPYPYGFLNGKYVPFELLILQDGVPRRDTFEIQLYMPEILSLYNNSGSMDGWLSTGWGVEYIPGLNSYVLSDSPYRFYSDTLSNFLAYSEEIDLNGYRSATLDFLTMWNIEKNFDVAHVQISSDNGDSWVNLESSRMVEGLGLKDGVFDEGEHGFSGVFPLWVRQECRLDDFPGQRIKLRFALLNDKYKHYDGWFLNDIRIRLYDDLTGVDEMSYKSVFSLECYPNPAAAGQEIFVVLPYYGNIDESTQARFVDLLGRRTNAVLRKGRELIVKTENLKPGLYFLELCAENKIFAGKILILP